MTTVAQAIDLARAAGVDRLDAQLLIAHRLGVDRPWLLAHGDVPLTDAQSAACRIALERRADGVPLSYIVGRREFHGLSLMVTPAVLDPRPDTETLVDWAIELIGAAPRRVVDLGTGSGAIALAVKQACPRAVVHATDSSAEALRVAHGNAQRLGLAVTFAQGDWWESVAGLRFDIAVSNPPYIAGHDPHLAALQHEPQHALTPGPRGLEAIEHIVAMAGDHLPAGAWLLLEHGFDQATAVRECLAGHGFTDLSMRHDLAGVPRCTGGRRAL